MKRVPTAASSRPAPPTATSGRANRSPYGHRAGALLRTSSYQWPYNAFETLIKKHGRTKVRAAITEHLRTMSDRFLVLVHKAASGDPMSPLSELRLPGDTWASK